MSRCKHFRSGCAAGRGWSGVSRLPGGNPQSVDLNCLGVQLTDTFLLPRLSQSLDYLLYYPSIERIDGVSSRQAFQSSQSPQATKCLSLQLNFNSLLPNPPHPKSVSSTSLAPHGPDLPLANHQSVSQSSLPDHRLDSFKRSVGIATHNVSTKVRACRHNTHTLPASNRQRL
jgi:hypothetical protein